MGYLLYN